MEILQWLVVVDGGMGMEMEMEAKEISKVILREDREVLFGRMEL